MTMPVEDESVRHPSRVARRALPPRLDPTLVVPVPVPVPPEAAAAAGTPYTADAVIIPGKVARVRMRRQTSEERDVEAKRSTAGIETVNETAQMTMTKNEPANDAVEEATDAKMLQLAIPTEPAQRLPLVAQAAIDTTLITTTDAMTAAPTAAIQDAAAATMKTIVVRRQDVAVATTARPSRFALDALPVPKSMITRSAPCFAASSLLDWANATSESSSRTIWEKVLFRMYASSWIAPRTAAKVSATSNLLPASSCPKLLS